ncbi:hypothetical protein HZA42_04295 [Candidatus Peregrinibacteria bacterium]|nr:hypothetical protein [Candidatus Peregrinibacteria bacterium]
MNSKHVIAEAWHFTRENPRLMWVYAFLPAVLNTLVGVLYLGYQFFAFKRSPLFDNAEKSFMTEVITDVFGFLNMYSLWLPAIIATIVIGIMYLLLPTLCQGALIQLIARKKRGENVRAIHGISFGLLVFLPLLEYHLLIKGFSLFSILTEAGFAWRNLGTDVMTTLLPVFIIAGVIGIILTLLFTYSEFFIVLNKRSVLAAMGRSAKLVIISWQHTFLIAILMAIIGLRVIINILAVLLVPTLLFLSAGLVATFTLPNLGIIIGILISGTGLFVASYFTGILNLFANAVWTLSYMELMDEKMTQEFIE